MAGGVAADWIACYREDGMCPLISVNVPPLRSMMGDGLPCPHSAVPLVITEPALPLSFGL